MARRKKITPLHWLVFGLFCIGVTGFVIYIRVFYQPPTPTELKTQAADTVSELADYLSVTPEIRESIYWDFLTEDNQMLPLTGYEFFIGTINVPKTRLYNGINTDTLEKISPPFLTKVADEAGTFFAEEKFKANIKNSRIGENDPLQTLYRGYEKGQIKCMTRLNPQSDPFGTFFCGIVDTHQQTLQKQLGGLFSTTYNPKKPHLFRVELLENDFARGSYNESVLGHVFIAQKTDGKWHVIWTGEEAPMCAEMERLGIPEPMYEHCYSEE